MAFAANGSLSCCAKIKTPPGEAGGRKYFRTRRLVAAVALGWPPRLLSRFAECAPGWRAAVPCCLRTAQHNRQQLYRYPVQWRGKQRRPPLRLRSRESAWWSRLAGPIGATWRGLARAPGSQASQLLKAPEAELSC